MDIPELIKHTRKSLGLTQADFGKVLGKSRVTVANWEAGNHKPDRFDAVQWSMLYSDWRKDLGLTLLVEYRKEG
jgi:transcriptional regulator with XRE-family HTH domain